MLQRDAVERWTRPSQLTIEVMAPVVGGDSDEAVALDSRVLARGDKTTLREIVDDACDKAGLVRDAYYW
jgi:hypothetical protein